MKRFLAKVFMISAMLLIIIGVLLPCFFENPEETYQLSSHENIIRKSGFSPKVYYPLGGISTFIHFSFFALMLYIDKLNSSLSCEKDILRLIKCYSLFFYLFIACFLLLLIQIPIAFISLIRIDEIQFADIVYSNLPVNLGVVFFLFGLFLYFYDVMKYHRTTPIPSILSHFNSALAYRQSCEVDPQ